jgi:superfamily II DNA/RNA helicase
LSSDILVSTPDRLLALIKENGIEMKRVQHLVLDEADKLFELGLVESVDEIIAACQNSEAGDKLTRSLFSATLPPSVEVRSLSSLTFSYSGLTTRLTIPGTRTHHFTKPCSSSRWCKVLSFTVFLVD